MATAAGTAATAADHNIKMDSLIEECSSGDTVTVRFLLESGVFANANSNGKIPIVAASTNGHIEIVKLLLEFGAKVDLQNDNGESALIHASMNGHIEIVNLLLEHAAEVDLQDNDGDSALNCACLSGHIEIVKLLLNQGAKIDNDNSASSVNEVVQVLEHGDPEYIVTHGQDYLGVLKNFIKQGQKNWSPLVAACVYGRTEIVRLLLDHGARVNILGNCMTSPLIEASGRGHTEIAQLLLVHDADVNMNNGYGTSPLIAASAHGRTETAKLLLAHGAEVNMKTSFGFDPLIAAVSQTMGMELLDIKGFSNITKSPEEHIEIVKLLLEHGAEVNARYKLLNMTGNPLSVAVLKGHVEIIKLLLEYGADRTDILQGLSAEDLIITANTRIVKALLKSCFNIEDSPFCCVERHNETLKFILSHDNTTDSFPLHMASFTGDAEAVKLLLDQGAQVNMQDHNGWSPLHIASFIGNTDTSKQLFFQTGSNHFFSGEIKSIFNDLVIKDI